MERPEGSCEICHHEAAQPGNLLGTICREAVERAGLAWRATRRGAVVQIAAPELAVAADARNGIVAKALPPPEDTQFFAQQKKRPGIASRRNRSTPWRGAKEGRHRVATQVFVVDDEKCISDSLTAILNACGFTASSFYSAESALAECEMARPDLVISDVMMPGMNGVEMAIVVKERYPECRILLFSGQAVTDDILEQAREKGYDFELLTKPVHPQDLLARLAEPEGHEPDHVFENTPFENTPLESNLV